jgi:membrane protein implicated in regulation of membrane protease activity
MTGSPIDPSLAWHVAGALAFCCSFILFFLVRKAMNAADLREPQPSTLARLVICGATIWAVFGAARVLGADSTNESTISFLIASAVGVWAGIAFVPRASKSQGDSTNAS